MEQFFGKTILPGISFGKIAVYIKNEIFIDTSLSNNSDIEWAAFLNAVTIADGQLAQLYKKTRQEIGEEEALIIDVQRMMLEDEDFLADVKKLIVGQNFHATYAVEQVCKQLYDQFIALDDAYMQARAPDIIDISRRLISVITKTDTAFNLSEPSVILADDLTPSDTLSLDRKLIRAFVTRQGSTNSHTAILARILKIPSIVQANVRLDKSFDGKEAAVDGHTGTLYIEPTETVKRQLVGQEKTDAAERQALEAMRGLPTITKSGKKIELAANIGNVEDL
ncbi:MAG: PEP-utilizing enzyme, partial [Treponema sp.]|nr:PEP-utilizing enzyme [Treponema sp.]